MTGSVWERPWQGGTVRHDPVADDAAAGAVCHLAGDADAEPVVSWSLGAVEMDGRPVEPVPGATRVDPDEIEFSWRIGPVVLRIRHTVEVTWQIRVAVTDTGPGSRIDRLVLHARAGTGRTAWAVRAGAEGSLVVLGDDPRRPGPAFALVQGEVRGGGTDLDHGPVVLEPGGSHVVRWRGEIVDDLIGFAGARHEVLPAWPVIGPADEAVVEHPDLAVVDERVDPGVLVTTSGDGVTTITGSLPAPGGAAGLTLAGPRGRTEVELRVVADLPGTARWWCERHPWSRGRQGIVVDDPAKALVVQSLVGDHEGGGTRLDEWGDALDGACARIEPTTSDDPVFAVILLAQQAVRTGDPELADRAASGVTALVGRPGAAVATALVLAACTLLDRPVPAQPQLDPADPLEAALVDGRRPGRAWSRWGRSVGYGLRGSALADGDPVADARRLAVASMAWELRRSTVDGWPVRPPEIVERHRRRLLADLGERPDDPSAAAVLAWLICGS